MKAPDDLLPVFAAKEYSANAEAEVLKSLLDSAGIDSLIRWVPPTFQSEGGIQLLVLAADLDEATELIRQAQQGDIEPVE